MTAQRPPRAAPKIHFPQFVRRTSWGPLTLEEAKGRISSVNTKLRPKQLEAKAQAYVAAHPIMDPPGIVRIDGTRPGGR